MVGMAAGLAKAGFKPIVYGLAAFVPIRVIEQIKIDVCYENLPVILIGDGAGLVYSQLGTSHQATEDIACVRAIPALTILSPADRFEMIASMQHALALSTPVYLRMGKGDRGDVHSSPIQIRAGELFSVKRGRQRLALISTGSMVKTAIEITQQGLDASVWSAPSIKPLNAEQLTAIAADVDAIITLEEHSVIGGLGSMVAEIISAQRPVPICCIGVNDRFSSSCGTWQHLLVEHEIDILSATRRIVKFLDTLCNEQKYISAK